MWGQRLIILVVALAGFGLLGPSPLMHHDTLEDYALARQCLEGTSCSAHTTSLEGIYQGRLLLYLLGGLTTAGLPPAAHLWLLLLLHAVAVVVVASFAARHFGRPSAAVAAVVFFMLSTTAAQHPVLWNPTLAPLPTALAMLGTAEVARSRASSTLWVAATGVAIGCAYFAHPVHLIAWLPFALVLSGSAASLGVRALGMTAPLAAPLLFDAQGLLENARAAGGLVGATVLLGVAAAALIGARLESRASRLDERRRLHLALYGVGGCLALGLALAAPLVGRSISARYLVLALPAASVGAGVLAQRWLKSRSRLVLALAGAAFALFTLPAAVRHLFFRSDLTLGDIAALERALHERGISLSSSARRLQGPHTHDILSAALVTQPALPTEHPKGTRVRIVVMGDRDAELPPDWQRVPLGLGQAVALSTHLNSRLETWSFRLCAVYADDRRICELLGDAHRTPASWSRLGSRAVQVGSLSDLDTTPSSFEQHIRVAAGPPGLVVLLDPKWQLRSVQGLEARAEGPMLTLNGAAGTLVLQQAATTPRGPAKAGILIELTAEERSLLPMLLHHARSSAR